MEDFGTLRFVSRMLEVLGWIAVVLGFITFFSSLDSLNLRRAEALVALLLAAGPIGVGLTLVLLGQAGRCFVAIEHNTRLANLNLSSLSSLLAQIQAPEKKEA